MDSEKKKKKSIIGNFQIHGPSQSLLFYSIFILFFIYLFLATLQSSWDLSSPIRDPTQDPWTRNADS